MPSSRAAATAKSDAVRPLSTPLRRACFEVAKVAHAVFTLVPLVAVLFLWGACGGAWLSLGEFPPASGLGAGDVFAPEGPVWALHRFLGTMLFASLLAWPLLTLALQRADSRFPVWGRVAVAAVGSVLLLVQATLDPLGVVSWWLS